MCSYRFPPPFPRSSLQPRFKVTLVVIYTVRVLTRLEGCPFELFFRYIYIFFFGNPVATLDIRPRCTSRDRALMTRPNLSSFLSLPFLTPLEPRAVSLSRRDRRSRPPHPTLRAATLARSSTRRTHTWKRRNPLPDFHSFSFLFSFFSSPAKKHHYHRNPYL